jgi:hypothetical protein
MKATSGVRDWLVEGELELRNMPMTDTQTSIISVTSTGTLDIPFEYTIESENPDVLKVFKVVVRENQETEMLSKKSIIRPKQVIHLDINITPIEFARITGKFVVSTDLGKGKVTKSFVFDFYTYDKQVAFDYSQDINVGRIMVGEKSENLRIITNYGASKVKFRTKIEPVLQQEQVDPKKKKVVAESPKVVIPWTAVGDLGESNTILRLNIIIRVV